ncbi:vanadium-dependent haloperoxidase [Solitalea sp. MAHUQ-68]|uniref:Vanadium-dependent haloperoxidase n=1 Tax=Solitalea agri TaxID=2953739 RepID=A0A9X2F042_9SPHI|nr:vanadium-dependent haloperoxidase [Solitalea agri]MCO4291660.1 vanadium-dependent haloperoxidase [Solitalea agri]
MKKTGLRFSLFLFCIITFLQACKKDDNNSPSQAIDASNWGSFVPVSWYNLELKLIKETPGFTPPVAARAIAYTSITLHETVVRGMPDGTSLSGQLDGLSYLPYNDPEARYNWAIAANSAMADILRSLFGNASSDNQALIDQLEVDNQLELTSSEFTQEDIDRSIDFGKQMANAIYLWSASDKGQAAYLDNFPASYVPPVGNGLWEPTPPLFQSAMLPYWSKNRFLFSSNKNIINQIAAPPTYSVNPTSTFYQAANFVYETVNSLTQEETYIANYWADATGTFTPAGHMLAITAQLVKDNNLTLDIAAQLFTQVGIALNDVAIVCWDCKYKYNLVRPITYIHKNINPAWNGKIGTPPFPSYVSEHASFTSATGTILGAYFGTSFSFTDNQKVSDGFSPKTFNNFQDMIDEAAYSRVYGGIHYEFDINEGKTLGKSIADQVLTLKF